jgi:hypothetical protein
MIGAVPNFGHVNFFRTVSSRKTTTYCDKGMVRELLLYDTAEDHCRDSRALRTGRSRRVAPSERTDDKIEINLMKI